MSESRTKSASSIIIWLIINKVLNIKFNLHSYLFLCLLARFLRNSAFILAAPDPCNPVI